MLDDLYLERDGITNLTYRWYLMRWPDWKVCTAYLGICHAILRICRYQLGTIKFYQWPGVAAKWARYLI